MTPLPDTVLAGAIRWLPRLVTAVLVLAVFWMAGRLAGRVIGRLASQRHLRPDLAILGRDAARLVLLSVGVVTALGTLGLDVTAMVATLGLTGFALGFALRDALSNFLAGIMVLVYEPFERGESIEVSGKKGVVREINLRYTILEGEGETYLVPNSTLLSNIISVTETKKTPAER